MSRLQKLLRRRSAKLSFDKEYFFSPTKPVDNFVDDDVNSSLR